jgi:geranylgeranyl pyrophosphate synthase
MAVLQKRSREAMKLTKAAILEEEMETAEAEKALEYYLSKWDDTTRPGILSAVCEAVRPDTEKTGDLQIPLMMIAAAMDIHDDIIDRSATKNGEPTVFGEFGLETALLLGNAFLVKGFNCLQRAVKDLSKDRGVTIMDAVKDFLFKVIDAHVREIALRQRKWEVEPDEYLQVLEGKAADIEGRVRTGAIFVEASAQQVQRLNEFGRNLGILLAVRSEFVDIFDENELLSRVKNECLPLPILYAIKNRSVRRKIEQILSKEKINPTDVNDLLRAVYDAPETQDLREYLFKAKKEALRALECIGNGQAKSDLLLLVSAMTEDL